MLMTSHQDTGQDGVSFSPGLGPVATIRFSGDDRWSQHPLGLIVGGLQAVHVQEAQQVRAMLSQAFGEADIVGIGESAAHADEPIQLVFQSLDSVGEGEGIQAWLLYLELHGLAQQSCHLLSKLQGPTGLALLHVLQVRQQMAQAPLLQPSDQASIIVRQEVIRSQNAFEFFAQEVNDHITAAVGTDGIDRDLPIREDPQPGRQRPNPPTGFIRMDNTALADQLDQPFIHRSRYVCQFLIRLAPATPADVQAKRILEHFAHFAVRNSQPVLQIRGQGLRRRPDQDPGCPRGCRGLFRMARSHSFLATPTPTTVGQEARRLHLDDRDVSDTPTAVLVLADCSQSATALRTARQFGFLRLLDLLPARQFSTSKLTLARFPSWPFGIFHPMPTSEWCGLAFPGSLQLLHFGLQKLHLLLQLLNGRQSLSQLLLQFGNLLLLWIRKVVLLMSHLLRHLYQQCTFSSASLTRVFLPVFCKTFDPFQKIAVAR